MIDEQRVCIDMGELISEILCSLSENKEITVSGMGSSMYPFINDKTDKIVLCPVFMRGIKTGDICLYKRNNGQYVIHRVYSVRKHRCNMLGDGQLLLEKGVSKDKILACVCEIKRANGSYRCDTAYARIKATVHMRTRYRKYLTKCFFHSIRYYMGLVFNKLFGK